MGSKSILGGDRKWVTLRVFVIGHSIFLLCYVLFSIMCLIPTEDIKGLDLLSKWDRYTQCIRILLYVLALKTHLSMQDSRCKGIDKTMRRSSCWRSKLASSRTFNPKAQNYLLIWINHFIRFTLLNVEPYFQINKISVLTNYLLLCFCKNQSLIFNTVPTLRGHCVSHCWVKLYYCNGVIVQIVLRLNEICELRFGFRELGTWLDLIIWCCHLGEFTGTWHKGKEKRKDIGISCLRTWLPWLNWSNKAQQGLRRTPVLFIGSCCVLWLLMDAELVREPIRNNSLQVTDTQNWKKPI